MRKQRRYDEIMKDLQETNAGDRKRIRRLCNELKRFRVCSRRERIGEWIEHMVLHYGLCAVRTPCALVLPVLRSDDVQHDTLNEKSIVKLQEDRSERNGGCNCIRNNEPPEPASSVIDECCTTYT